jgi:hypothetical protein
LSSLFSLSLSSRFQLQDRFRSFTTDHNIANTTQKYALFSPSFSFFLLALCFFCLNFLIVWMLSCSRLDAMKKQLEEEDSWW